MAAQTVQEVLAGESLSACLTKLRLSDIPLGPDDHGAIQDLAYGTLRHLTELRAYVEHMTERVPTDPAVNALLWVGLYQLIYSRNAPHAVVNEAVTAVGATKPWAKGLVNAILRRFMRERDALLRSVRTDVRRRYSYPDWWIDRVRQDHPACWEQMLAEGNRHPPMALRVNRRAISRDDYLGRLRLAGLEATAQDEAGILLDTPVSVSRLPGFEDGEASVQDLGAQHAARFLDVRDGMRVLDACAAPGGKTAHLLERADLDLLALDQDADRLRRVTQNLTRLRLRGAVARCADATQPATWWDGRPFHRVLLDAPCSASGVVRRHPDSKWLRRSTDIAQFALQQRRLLEALWRVMESGGKLLYVTCSIFKMENEDLIEAFLLDTPDAERVPVGPPPDSAGSLLPNANHDGFFYAALRKLAR